MGRIRQSELPPGTTQRLEYPPFHILIANLGGVGFAIDDTCNHAGESLAKGDLEGCTVSCPAHGYVFDVRSGALITPVGLCQDQRTFEVEIEGEEFVVYDRPLVLTFG